MSNKKNPLNIVQRRGDEVLTEENQAALISKYFNSAQDVFEKLNRVSKSFCLAKWYTVSIHLTTGRTHSCYHPPTHEIPLKSVLANPTQLHNTDHKKQQRQLMLNGERPKECDFCWQVEDSSGDLHLSDRAYRSNDIYTETLMQEAIQLGAKGNPIPRYVEVNFNQSCNLKCTYCSPHLSTTWMKEIEKHGPLKVGSLRHNDIDSLKESGYFPDSEKSKTYQEAFWNWWPEIYEKLRFFRMTGGEPLLDKNTFRVFDWVESHPKKDLELGLTSNCCPPEVQWDAFMNSLARLESVEAYEHFMLFCSLDTFGSQAEYIRSGLNFELLQKNVRRFLSENDRTSITFIVTYNNLSLVGFEKLLKWILELRQEFSVRKQKIWIDTPMLHDPKWMSIKILPKEYLSYIEAQIKFMEQHLETPETRFKGFKDFEVDRLKRLYLWMTSGINDPKLNYYRAQFYQFFKQIDERRNCNLEKTFPELQNFISLCRESYLEANAEPS